MVFSTFRCGLGFALLVGIFLQGYVFAQDLRQENAILKKQLAELRAQLDKVNKQNAERKNVEKLLRKFVKEKEILLKELRLTKAEADMLKAELLAQNVQLKLELKQKTAQNNALAKTIAEVQNEFLKLKRDRDALAQALARNEFLLNKIRKSTKKKPAPVPIDPKNNKPNPPTEKIEAVIQQVSKSGNLVLLAVGSDAGLQKGHTLEVIRLSKNAPKYLGRIRIVEVGPFTAVGIVIDSGRKVEVRVGDKVMSNLQKK